MRGLKLDPVRHLAVPAAFLAMVAFNILAVTLPLGGRATQEISALFENMLTPAGYAFSIWSVIYAGMLAFTLYQFLPSQAEDREAGQVSLLFVISCLLNLSWLISWHFLWIPLSTIFMVALFLVLALIWFRVTARTAQRTPAYRLMVALPFRLYLGWITVAMFANFGALFTQRGGDWAALGETGWSVTALLVIVVLTAAALLLRRDMFLTLAVIWGLVAISFGPAATTVSTVGGLLAAALLAGLAVLLFMRGRKPGSEPGAPAAVTQKPAAHREFTDR